MTYRKWSVVTVTVLAALLTAAGAHAQSIAVPAYIYPPWPELVNGAPTVSVAVMNPDSGPGPGSDTQYVSAVKSAHAAGILVLGYVYTSYGSRSLSAVESDINTYYRRYGVDGIFLDEASTSCSEVSYYATLSTYIKAKAGVGRVILNPGTSTNSCYVTVADTLVTFEGAYSQYVDSYSAPAWEARYAPSHFWHIIYDTPTSSDLDQVVQLSKARGAGYVYVTPDTLPNPYGALPSGAFWQDELADIG